jgi:hypothetical protein
MVEKHTTSRRAMNQAKMRFVDLLVPWVLVIGTIGFLLAWLVVTILEYTGLLEQEMMTKMTYENDQCN